MNFDLLLEHCLIHLQPIETADPGNVCENLGPPLEIGNGDGPAGELGKLRWEIVFPGVPKLATLRFPNLKLTGEFNNIRAIFCDCMKRRRLQYIALNSIIRIYPQAPMECRTAVLRCTTTLRQAMMSNRLLAARSLRSPVPTSFENK